MTTPQSIVIIGVGNDYRCDDGAGLHAARRLRDMNLPDVRVIDGIADGTDLINAWQESDTAFVIDSVVSDAESGTIHRFDGLLDDIREDLFPGYSTHAFSIPETIKLARVLNRLPGRLVIYGIEAEKLSSGADLSRNVSSGVEEVVQLVANEIENLRRGNEGV